MEDKLEVGQVRIWNSRSGILTIKYIGTNVCVGVPDLEHNESSYPISYVLKNSKPVKLEPKEIKVKWYRDNGSIFCTDTNSRNSINWKEVDFKDGKFYEKGV